MEALVHSSFSFLPPLLPLIACFNVMEIRTSPHIFSLYFYVPSAGKETKTKFGHLDFFLKCVSEFVDTCGGKLECLSSTEKHHKASSEVCISVCFLQGEMKAWSLVCQSKQCKVTPAIFSKRPALRPIVWHESNIKRCVRKEEECSACQIKMIKKTRRLRGGEEKGNERRKRPSEFLRGSGLAWTCWNTHTVTGRGGESEWEEKDEEDEEEEEYRAPARDRLQHAGFDRMAPPGAGNTKPCDYPKHTGSDWVSEPALFPTLLLWPVWDERLCSAILPSQQSTFSPWSQK